jgi:uncharacterized RDD family membrane protein YckC
MTTNQTNPTETKEYPSLLKRVKAAFIDIVAIILFMYGTSDLFSLFEQVPDSFRISAFIFIWILYDPIWVSLLGGTIGHRYMGIRVKKERNELKNISFPAAVFRYFVKSTLGWFSYLTMSGSQKKKALHDNAVGSVVVFE